MEGHDWALIGTARRPGAILPASSLVHGSEAQGSSSGPTGLVRAAGKPCGWTDLWECFGQVYSFF
jgi:hypothetical protein